MRVSPLTPLMRIGNAWVRRDAAVAGPVGGGGPAPDTFVLGQTEPNASNTGPRIADIDLVPYAGSFTNAQGATIRGLAITGVINLGAGDGNAVFEDCLIQYGKPPTWPPSTTTVNTYRGASLFSTHTGTVTLNFCEFRPNGAISPSDPDTGPQPGTYLSWDTYGIQGGDIVVYRCEIHHTVDGITGQGFLSGGARRTVKFHGNYIHDLQWYAADPGKTDGSHNDGIVGEGNADFEEIGNAINNRTIASGKASCTFINNNVPGNYAKVYIADNWYYPNEVTSSTAINIGADPCNNLTVIRNRIYRNTNTASGKIFVKAGTRALATTDLGLSLGGTGTAVVGRCNVYMDDGSPYPISNG